MLVPQLPIGDNNDAEDKAAVIRKKPVSAMSARELVFLYKAGLAAPDEIAELKRRIAKKKSAQAAVSAPPATPSPHSSFASSPLTVDTFLAPDGAAPDDEVVSTAHPSLSRPVLPRRKKIADLDPYDSIVDDDDDDDDDNSFSSSAYADVDLSTSQRRRVRADGSRLTASKREPISQKRRGVSPVNADLSAEANVMKKIGGMLKSALHEPVFICALIVLLFLICFMRPFIVPSGSMKPTLMEGDRILSIAQYFPNGQTYSRGDIACFTAPDGTVYVKRVIGIGGDHIQISGEKVYVNGEESPYQGTGGVMTSMDVQLADDEYWMMGDNRGNSLDSRYIGAIKADKMISRVLGIYNPVDRMTILE